MLELVKKCPVCDRIYPYTEDECKPCGRNLRAEPSIPRPHGADCPVASEQQQEQSVHNQASIHEVKPVDKPAEPFLVLESGNGSMYTIHNGDTVGKMRDGSMAQVQLGDECDGAVHRYHCLFEFEKEHWVIIPLSQGEPHPTNKTFVNDCLIRVQTRFLIENKDRVRLADTEYRVHLSYPENIVSEDNGRQ
jgi:hypothetical protein